MLAFLDSTGSKISLAAFATSALLASSAMAAPVTVFDDSFADGDQAATGALDTNWWTSSSSSGDEISVGSLGLVTGGSGRGIHTVFDTQTLTNVGDKLTATYTFMTPATVGSGQGAAFRVGLFDSLERAVLDNHVSASSGTPNEAAYGRSVGNGGTGTVGLPGYMLDMDVNDGTDDLNFRQHNVDSATGRLMATTGGGSFSSFSSGPDNAYSFTANTEYTGSVTVELTAAGEITITGTLGGASYSIVDDDPETTSFGFLGFHVNGNQFGSSSSAGDPDNGIDFSNINVVFEAVPEPSSLALLSLGGLAMMRRRK